jgi:long-chain acyl-CoA synthetase
MRVVDALVQLEPPDLDRIAWIQNEWELGQAGQSQEWTWSAVRSQCAVAIEVLLDLGVRSQDRVVNLGRNSLAWAIVDLACSALNAIHVPIDARQNSLETQGCIELVEPKLIFSDPLIDGCVRTSDLLRTNLYEPHRISESSFEQLLAPYNEQDAANILFTSGTTSKPRGVMLSHRNLVSNAMAKLNAMPQVTTDHRLNFLPFAHAYARTCELTTWLFSKSSIEVSYGIEGTLKHASIARPTLINGVPAFYERLLDRWKQLNGSLRGLHEILGDRLRQLASGGAALSDAHRQVFQEHGQPIFQGYGLTEASPVVCSNRNRSLHVENHSGHLRDPAILDGVGPVVSGTRIRMDDDGELWVKGDGVMLGYWRDPEATQKAIVDGWLKTGDLAEYRLHESNCSGQSSGSIRILGRADDTLVLSNGNKVQPAPIEQLLHSQPWIDRCMLVGTNRPYTVLLLKDQIDGLDQEGALGRIADLFQHLPKAWIPKKILTIQEEWNAENGLTNFKGALKRAKIEEFYREAIDRIYLSIYPSTE